MNLEQVLAVVHHGPYGPTWESLAAHPDPQWFANAKFGIFTHWGLYTVPEYRNEWYSRNMYIQGYPEYAHHREVYGPQHIFGYKDFIPLFTAKNFNPNSWAELFANAGAKYYMMVSEHHDGFQMYGSELSRYNSLEMGPHRDIVAELKQAAAHNNLHFALSNHRAEHWWFMGHGREFDSDVREPMSRGDFYWPAMPEPNEFDIDSTLAPTEEYLEDWLLRVCEIIDRYQPELLYFDWWIQHKSFKKYLKLMAAYYYNRAAERGVEGSICYKYDALAWGSGIPDVERGGFPEPTPFVWQTDTAIARNSWCYTDTLDYKTLPELLVTLVDTVSKNGNLLLNVGPRADGSIAAHDQELLNGIGNWLNTNGDGIYNTRPWRVAGEGPTVNVSGMFADQNQTTWTAQDWRFTAGEGELFAFCLNPATEDGTHLQERLNCTTFAAFDGKNQPKFNGVIASVEQLGEGEVSFTRTPESLTIIPQRTQLNDPHLPLGFRLSLG